MFLSDVFTVKTKGRTSFKTHLSRSRNIPAALWLLSPDQLINIFIFAAVKDHISLFFFLHLGGDFQAQGIQANEAGGVVLVAGFGGVGFHGGSAFARVQNGQANHFVIFISAQ